MRELEGFILEFGKGFAFVERQKRMIVDGEDFYLDLLFFHRITKRLVAVELKIGKFQAQDKGQMELYLKWLDRYERQEGENAPMGLILCAAASREQVELLEMHKDGIMVAEYWTELPPKKEFEQKIHALLREAQERQATRQALAVNDHLSGRGLGSGNYTEDRHAWLDSMTRDEILEGVRKIEQARQQKPSQPDSPLLPHPKKQKG